jgi:phosphatidate cytidylyltransferase
MERTFGLVGSVVILLAVATAVVQILKRRTESGIDPAVLETFRRRVRAWWYLCTILAATILVGQTATILLFWLVAFWALREFITLTPTRPGDHRALFWVFFLCTPLQFFLVWMERYGMYSIVIPVYAFLLVPAGIALSGDAKRFLERTAKIQTGLLICVYCISYAPALLTLPLPKQVGAANQPQTKPEFERSSPAAQAVPAKGGETPAIVKPERDPGGGARLLFFFILIVQLSDALQYAWSLVPSKHVIVPTINPTKTWEGLLGGTASVALIGAVLWWATPFPYWFAACMSAVIALMGFAGSITMSAIKRDRGVKDYGTLVEGHGGVLDRIDSLCFAAPIFFHFTCYYLIVTGVMDVIQF